MRELSKEEILEVFLDKKPIKKGCLYSWREPVSPCSKFTGRYFLLSTGSIYRACEAHLNSYLANEALQKRVEERIKKRKEENDNR